MSKANVFENHYRATAKRPTGLAPKTKQLHMTHVQLATLVINFLQAVKHQDIGYENAKKTLAEFLREIGKLPKVTITVEALEDLLCACNARDESKEWFTPKDGESFDSFLSLIFWGNRIDGVPLVFDKDYNVITYKPIEEAE